MQPDKIKRAALTVWIHQEMADMAMILQTPAIVDGKAYLYEDDIARLWDNLTKLRDKLKKA